MCPIPQTFIPTGPLFYEAQAEPYDINKQLRRILYSPDLAPRLDILIHGQASQIGQPRNNDPARPINHYQSCLLIATMLGRAYAMVAPDPVADADQATDVLSKTASSLPYELILYIYEDYLANLRTRHALWKVVSSILVRAFFSHLGDYPGALYAAAVLLLTCGKALGRTPCLVGRTTRWDLFDGRVGEPDRIFRWHDIVDAAMKRKPSPPNSTDSRAVKAARGRRNARARRGLGRGCDGMPSTRQVGVEYVSQEIFDMLETARGHLLDREREDDWSTAEVLDRFLLKPNPGTVVASEQFMEL